MIADFKKKQKSGALKKIGIFLIGICIAMVAVFLVMANVNMYKKRQELNAQVRALQNKIAETKSKNLELQRGISEADNDQYLEKVAREELDMQKPGEKVFSFIKPQTQNTPSNEEQKSIWQKWLSWTSGLFKK